ncbi:MAG: DUF6553 family protein [Christensenellales bacterium]
MPQMMITCNKCKKEYQTDSDLAKSYCLFCGAENARITAKEFSYDPVSRKNFFIQQINENTADKDLYQDLLSLWPVRYKPMNKTNTKYADTFLGLWVTLVLNAKNPSFLGFNRSKQDIGKFFHQKELSQALDGMADPETALYHELLHSARTYVNTCKNDHQYGSVLSMIKMKEENVARKIANDTAAVINYACRISLPKHTKEIINALYSAYKAEMPKYADLIDKSIDGFNPAVQSAIKETLD